MPNSNASQASYPSQRGFSSQKHRHTRQFPCPVCKGYDDRRLGDGRCYGFTSGEWVHCTNTAYGGDARYNEKTQAWVHFIAQRQQQTHNSPEQQRNFDYHHSDGTLRFRVCRIGDKKEKRIWQCRPDGKGGWINNLEGVQLIPYRLPELLRYPNAVVYVVEGEPKVEALRQWGLIATCNPKGAMNWLPSFSEYLRGRQVVILSDNDDETTKPPYKGQKHGQDVAQKLAKVDAHIKVVTLPDLPPKGDIVDWIAAGGTKGALLQLVDQTKEWVPDEDRQVEEAVDKAARLEAQEEAPLINETDLGNAERLKHLFGQCLRYCKPWKSWLWYDGKRWKRDESGAAQRAAHKTVRSIYKEAAACQDTTKRKELGKWALTSESDKNLRALLHQAESLLPIMPEQLDAHPMLLNCLNGTIDLETGQLRPHNPEDYLMKCAPVNFDPNARLSKFERFLDGITCQDAELRAYLQRALGYSITGITREKVVFFGYGEKDSGKTTLLESLKATLGDYASTADFNAFLRHRNDNSTANPGIADLKGRRFVGSSEVDEGASLAVALVKWLSGGDTLTARMLHENPVSFKPTHKLWLIANHTPKVPTDDDAIWGRIKRIPFKMKLTQVDESVKADLTNPEIAGAAILAWLVQGCHAWQGEGIGTCKAVEDSTAEYRKDNDQFAAFIEECCIELEHAKATSAALWGAYIHWVEEGKERLQITRKKFGDLLKQRGCEPTTIGHAGSKAWQGIGLRATDADGSTQDADASAKGSASKPEAARKANADGSISKEHIFFHEGPTNKKIPTSEIDPSAKDVKVGQECREQKIVPSAPRTDPSALANGRKPTDRQRCYALLKAQNFCEIRIGKDRLGGSERTWNSSLFGKWQVSDQQVKAVLAELGEHVA